MTSFSQISGFDIPARKQIEYFLLARFQLGDGRRWRGRYTGCCRANSSITVRVTAGASSASPLATIRTAAAISSGGASLSMKPLAPCAQCVVDVGVEARAEVRRRARTPARGSTDLALQQRPDRRPARPEQAEAVKVDEIVAETQAKDHHLFAGRIDKGKLGFAERAVMRAVGAAEGDYRD